MFYAKWQGNTYTISFVANGGNGSMATMVVTFGRDDQKSLTSNSFYRAGYDFLGWSTDFTAAESSYQDATPIQVLGDALL